MACWTMLKRGQSAAVRKAEVKAAAKRLEKLLAAGKAKAKIGPQGAVAFEGWAQADRDDVSDVCAFRELTTSKSWALEKALAEAEAASGRKVDPKMVAVGWHSHDSGRTWGKH